MYMCIYVCVTYKHIYMHACMYTYIYAHTNKYTQYALHQSNVKHYPYMAIEKSKTQLAILCVYSYAQRFTILMIP